MENSLSQTVDQSIPAGAWGRLWANAIDSLYILIISYFLYLPFLLLMGLPIQGLDKLDTDIRFGIIYLVLSLIYTVYFNVNRGATLGKDAYGFKIINYNTQDNLNYPQAIIREITKTGMMFIPTIWGLSSLINGLVVVFSKQKRGFHDFFAKSQVIKIKQPWSMGKQALMILLPIVVVIGLLVFSNLQRINPAKQLNQNQQVIQNTEKNIIDTTDWKTYTNKKYQTTFSYPSDWVLNNQSDLENQPVNFHISNLSTNDSLNVNISDGATEIMIGSYYSKPTTEQLTIAGAKAYKNIEGNVTYIAIRHPVLKDTLIIISYVGSDQILNMFIDSIKFQ